MARVAKGRGKARDYKKLATIESAHECVACGSTDFSRGEDYERLDFPGTLEDGTAYRYVTWHKRQCKACGQWHAVRVYHIDPIGS